MQASVFSMFYTEDIKYKQPPQCIACQRKFSEKTFASLQQNGHNILWNIDYAICPSCGGEAQGWLA